MKELDNFSKLRQQIIDDVFVTDKEERIINENTTSGLSSWIFDFRKVALRPDFLPEVSEIFFKRIKRELKDVQICGLEVASIPLLAGIVTASAHKGEPINGFFLRKSRKKSGLLRMVEGTVLDTTPIVIIDDLLNTGSSVLKQVAVLEEMGRAVAAVFVIVRFREESYYRTLEEKNIKIYSIFTLDDFPELGLSLLKREKEISRPFQANWAFKPQNPKHELVFTKSTPVIVGDNLLFGADNGTFYCLNRFTAEVMWEHKIFSSSKRKVFSSPVFIKDSVFFGASDGNLYSININNGKKNWVFEESDWITSTPCVSSKSNTVFAALEYGLFSKKSGIVSLDVNNANVIWRIVAEFKITSDPIICDELDILIVGYHNGLVCAYSTKNGRQIWSFKTQGKIEGSFVLDKKKKTVFFGSFDGKFYALSLDDGALLWHFTALAGICSTACIDDENIFFTSLDKKIYCLTLSSGKLVWNFTTNGRIFASPEIIQDEVYIGSNDGVLYVIDKKTGQPHAVCQLSERITNKILYDENENIYVTTAANEIYSLKRN